MRNRINIENNAVTDLRPHESLIILNISSLNSVIKRQKLLLVYKEIWLNYMPFKRNSILTNDICGLKVNGLGKDTSISLKNWEWLH